MQLVLCNTPKKFFYNNSTFIAYTLYLIYLLTNVRFIYGNVHFQITGK